MLSMLKAMIVGRKFNLGSMTPKIMLSIMNFLKLFIHIVARLFRKVVPIDATSSMGTHHSQSSLFQVIARYLHRVHHVLLLHDVCPFNSQGYCASSSS